MNEFIKKFSVSLLLGWAVFPHFVLAYKPIDEVNIHTQSIVKIESFNNDGYLPCTGTLLANRWVLTAAHCVIHNNEKVQHTDAVLADSEIFRVKNTVVHPHYLTSNIDLALLELNQTSVNDDVIFLELENQPHRNIVNVSGYGMTSFLTMIPMHTSPTHVNSAELLLNNTQKGSTRLGDSGAPYLLGNRLVGIHNGSFSYDSSADLASNHAYGIKLSHPDVAAFIQQTIDGWHFPNSIQVYGKKKVQIQSLHREIEAIMLFSEGDVVIHYTESSCQKSSVISPFDTCYFMVESRGGKGKIVLSDHEVVSVN